MFQNVLENMMALPRGPFQVSLRAYSAPFFEQYDAAKVQQLNYSGKMLLPPSALDTLMRMHIEYPMMFKVTNPDPDRQHATHVGVLEFLAEEGRCYLPAWAMRQLQLNEGDRVTVGYTQLRKATYAKFQPQSADFIEHITNPRAMLEIKLREFSCLTRGDIFSIFYIDRVYDIQVKELKPGNAVSIVECDMNVEFDAPLGYQEPGKSSVASSEANSGSATPAGLAFPPSHPSAASLMSAADAAAALALPDKVPPPGEGNVILPFSGSGLRLDGRKKKTSTSTAAMASSASLYSTSAEGAQAPAAPPDDDPKSYIAPDYEYTPGRIEFVRNYIRLEDKLKLQRDAAAAGGGSKASAANLQQIQQEKAELAVGGESFVPFGGSGKSLR